MTRELMLSMLNQANTGTDILNALDAIVSVNPEKETVLSVMMPKTAKNFKIDHLDHDSLEEDNYTIVDWKGNKVVF